MPSNRKNTGLQKAGIGARRAKRAREPGILDARQIKAVAMLAGGTTPRAKIAKRVGVHRGTLNRWEVLPQFRQALATIAAEAVEDAARMLKANAGKAALRLIRGLTKEGDQGARCAVEILRQVLGDPAKIELNVNQTQAQAQLPPEFLQWLDQKGG